MGKDRACYCKIGPNPLLDRNLLDVVQSSYSCTPDPTARRSADLQKSHSADDNSVNLQDLVPLKCDSVRALNKPGVELSIAL